MKKGNFYLEILVILMVFNISNSKLILTGPVPDPDPRKFVEGLNQATWYKSYDSECDCHTIGIKFYVETSINLDFIDPYLISVNRKFDTLYSEETVNLFEDNKYNSKFRYYLPEYNGLHRKKKSYVIWDIQNFTETCHVEFKIKYFDCDEAAMTYYNNIVASDKKKVIFRVAEESNLQFGDFQDNLEIKRVLTNLMECEVVPKEKCADCCMPYPCLVNAESINCVCALMPESPECDCAKKDNCSAKYKEIMAPR